MKNKANTYKIISAIIAIIAILCFPTAGKEMFDTEKQETVNVENEVADSDASENVESYETDNIENQLTDDNAQGFRNEELLDNHYEKHGMEMGFSSAEEYEQAAIAVTNNPDALYKTEAEDGDGVYYVEKTNEFVIISQDGYIRTYFNPSDGIDYYNRQ